MSENREKTITVAGVTFSAKDVKSAIVEVDGREIHIGERKVEPGRIGFRSEKDTQA